MIPGKIRPPALVYCVGIGGCGMSGLAHLLLDGGYKVAGSDLQSNEETQRLADRGAVISPDHSAELLKKTRPALVAYSSAIPARNPELEAAGALAIPAMRRSRVLAAVVRARYPICVTGMHGKTTTSGLLAFVLSELRRSTGHCIGGHVPQLGGSAGLLGAGEGREANRLARSWFALEADESDGSLVDFEPEHSVILNVDEEHLDYYVHLERAKQAFEQFYRSTRGLTIVSADDPELWSVFKEKPGVVAFGFGPEARYRLTIRPSDPVAPHLSRFAVHLGGRCLGEFVTRLPGRANVSNAGAVIALLSELGLPAGALGEALRRFRGVRRRQEVIYCDSRYRVFDDYGHHPTEIQSTIRALNPLVKGRLLAVFQPHRFTRTRDLMEQFGTCFGGVHRLWLTEIHGAREIPIPGINGEALAGVLRRAEVPVEFVPNLADLGPRIMRHLMPGDGVLFLGAGGITQCAHGFAAALREKVLTGPGNLADLIRGRVGPGTIVRRDEPLHKRTTLRVGGPADVYVEPACESDLANVLEVCAESGQPVFLLGRGSNLVVRDGGIRGVVLSLGMPFFSKITRCGTTLLCGAGARLKKVVGEARRHGIQGLEFLEGIPGTIGGALRMNAGAMGFWIFQIVETIRVMDARGRVYERSRDRVISEYRGCPLLKTHIALEAVLRGDRAEPEAIRRRMSCFSHRRWEAQPAGASAGCIFKNPQTLSAGKLIEDLGLKGTQVGGARVSRVHGNFIINDGRASASDVLGLIDLIRRRVHESRGIELETEVQIVGQ